MTDRSHPTISRGRTLVLAACTALSATSLATAVPPAAAATPPQATSDIAAAARQWAAHSSAEARMPRTTLPLPTTAIPTRGGPFAFPQGRHRMQVRAGDVVSTPCFSTVASRDGVAIVDGCYLDLATQALGPGTSPDIPYFTASGFYDENRTLASLQLEQLTGIAATHQRLDAENPPAADVLAEGPFRIDYAGPYLGTTPVRLFGRPAIRMSWGFSSARATERKDTVVVLLPAGRYVAAGHPLTGFMVQGYPLGYQPREFLAALRHLRMR